MTQNRINGPIRILFFIGYLGIGGKERRLIELLGYLKEKKGYQLLVVTTKSGVELPKFTTLGIEMIVLTENKLFSKLNYFFHFRKIAGKFKPHIVHTWGRMQTLYALPFVLKTGTKLINGQITSAPPKVSIIDSLIDKVNFHYSDIILSNSKAGVEIFDPPENKTKVIYNGIDLCRFQNLPDISLVKNKYQIQTKYFVLMVANFSPNKDYEKFYRVGKILTERRNDVTWMGIGYFEEDSDLVKNCRKIIGDNPFMRIQSETTEVEALANACDIGVLFSNVKVHGEGISNAIIEYMALRKPVVANDAGGTKEVVLNNETGFLVQNEPLDRLADNIDDLLNNEDERSLMGSNGREVIEEQFVLNKMGMEFEAIYTDLLNVSRVTF